MPKKLDRCVAQVGMGASERSAYRICNSALNKQKKRKRNKNKS
jgi:hypothetical protein